MLALFTKKQFPLVASSHVARTGLGIWSTANKALIPMSPKATQIRRHGGSLLQMGGRKQSKESPRQDKSSKTRKREFQKKGVKQTTTILAHAKEMALGTLEAGIAVGNCNCQALISHNARLKSTLGLPYTAM